MNYTVTINYNYENKFLKNRQYKSIIVFYRSLSFKIIPINLFIFISIFINTYIIKTIFTYTLLTILYIKYIFLQPTLNELIYIY